MTITPQTLEDLVYRELGYDWSPNSVAMFVSIIVEWTVPDGAGRWDILPQIKSVVGGAKSTFGAEFDERVYEAQSFTRPDGGCIFDSDYDAV